MSKFINLTKHLWHVSELEKPSLNVISTTLLLSHILSFQLRSAFQPLKWNCFSQFYFHPRKEHSPSDLELWHVNMTYKHNLVWAKLNHHTKHLCQRSFCSKVIVWKHTHTHARTRTHTHTADWLHHLDHKVAGNKKTYSLQLSNYKANVPDQRTTCHIIR